MGCIEHAQKHKYGKTRYKGKSLLAHRVAYCEANNLNIGDIKGKVVRHTCDNPRCVNPDHLLIGTQQDNMNDMYGRGRTMKATGEFNGQAKLTKEDVLYIREHCVKGCRERGTAALARFYGIDQSQVSRVLSGQHWRESP